MTATDALCGRVARSGRDVRFDPFQRRGRRPPARRRLVIAVVAARVIDEVFPNA